jgi:cell division septum initiation protein DivIVA
LSDCKRQNIKLALALVVAMHGNLSLAETTSLETVPLPGNALFPPEQVAMTWPMLPGESVESLALLFYPKNKKMQQHFVAKTLQLSREIQPNLDPTSVSNQASLIVVPDIKQLSRQGGAIKRAVSKNSNPPSQPTLKMSYGLKDAALFVVTPKMQAGYDDLVTRNERLKQELEKLNAKLAQLQQVFATLATEATRALTSAPVPSPASTVESAPTALAEPVAVAKQNNPPAAKPVSEPTSLKQVVVADVEAKQSSFFEKYLSAFIWATLLVLGFLIGLTFYTRKQAKKLYLASAGNFNPLEQQVFIDDDKQAVQILSRVHDVDFSLTQTEYAGNMSVVELRNDNKEEGELALEQARIYVNIDRVDEAIELLKAQIEATPKASLHHWLYLLDIYRDTNQKEAFLQSAKQLHQSFNVMIPQWENVPLPMVIASSLEEFPHIVEQLTTLWAGLEKPQEKIAETKAYIEDLLTDNRGSDRTGFSMDVFQELLLLRDLLNVREKLAESDQE